MVTIIQPLPLVSIAMGQGDTSPNIWTKGDTITNVTQLSGELSLFHSW